MCKYKICSNILEYRSKSIRDARLSFTYIQLPSIPLTRGQTRVLRHPCIRQKPAPKGDGHVDVDPAVFSRCNPRTPSAGGYAHEETIAPPKTDETDLEARNRSARSIWAMNEDPTLSPRGN